VIDFLAHVPKEVLAKNFQLDITTFDHIPAEDLAIIPSGTYSTTQPMLFSDHMSLWGYDSPAT
jgi:hypothetical protein